MQYRRCRRWSRAAGTLDDSCCHVVMNLHVIDVLWPDGWFGRYKRRAVTAVPVHVYQGGLQRTQGPNVCRLKTPVAPWTRHARIAVGWADQDDASFSGVSQQQTVYCAFMKFCCRQNLAADKAAARSVP